MLSILLSMLLHDSSISKYTSRLVSLLSEASPCIWQSSIGKAGVQYDSLNQLTRKFGMTQTKPLPPYQSLNTSSLGRIIIDLWSTYICKTQTKSVEEILARIITGEATKKRRNK
ncbi:hypothetical protein H5410_026089, partial [Solanum commersonii]